MLPPDLAALVVSDMGIRTEWEQRTVMAKARWSDALVDHDELLRSLARLRGDITTSMSRIEIHGPLDAASAQLLDGSDELVLILTGRRETLHAPAHGRR